VERRLERKQRVERSIGARPFIILKTISCRLGFDPFGVVKLTGTPRLLVELAG